MVSMPEETMKKVMGSQNSHNFVVGSLFFGCVCVLFQSLPFFRSFLSSQNGFLFLFIRAERIHSDPKSNVIARSHSLLWKWRQYSKIVWFCCVAVAVVRKYVCVWAAIARQSQDHFYSIRTWKERKLNRSLQNVKKEMKINEKRKEFEFKSHCDCKRNVCLSLSFCVAIHLHPITLPLSAALPPVSHQNPTIPMETPINSIGILMKFTVLLLLSVLLAFLLPISLA